MKMHTIALCFMMDLEERGACRATRHVWSVMHLVSTILSVSFSTSTFHESIKVGGSASIRSSCQKCAGVRVLYEDTPLFLSSNGSRQAPALRTPPLLTDALLPLRH